MLLGKIANMEINVFFVDIATKEANIIAWLLEKFATNVMERTTSKICVDPVRDQREKGQRGLVIENVCTDVIYIKLEIVIMMMTVQLRIS